MIWELPRKTAWEFLDDDCINTAASIAGLFVIVLRALLTPRRTPVAMGIEALVGRTGIATSDLAPAGTVRVDSEIWSTLTKDDTIREGEEIEVISVQGVMLRVTKQ